MANKRYVCEQACQLGGKRYEVGEELADGVEPNSHFKDTKTGEMVKAKEVNKKPITVSEIQEKALNTDEIDKKIAEVKVESEKQLNGLKDLVGEHLAKFEKRLEALEKNTEQPEKTAVITEDEANGQTAPLKQQATKKSSES